MSRKPDPRPARTRARLFNALMELIQEKRWERITTQDILDRAEVGRSTFYAHFDNKFDLLTGEIPSLTLPIAAAEGKPDLLPLFEHVQEMRPVLRPLMSQPLLGEMLETFRRRLVDSWSDYLLGSSISPDRVVMASEILGSGLLATCRRWMDDDCRPGPAEMCASFDAYVTSVLAVAGDPAS